MFFLIGHRGVGKTSLIKKLPKAVDLDEIIDLEYGIDHIFKNQGEDRFREIEKETLNKILNQKKYEIISLGAGFDLNNYEFPKNSKFIWIQRDSDNVGRVFLDRPRLNKELAPIEEFRIRKKQRDSLYSKICDFKLALEEGDFLYNAPLKILKNFMEGKIVGVNRGYYTLTNDFEAEIFFGDVELRTDVFSEDRICDLLRSPRFLKKIVSIRTEKSLNLSFLKQVCKLGALVDLPIEYEMTKEIVEKFSSNEVFFSLHQNKQLKEVKELLLQKPHHLKWAPLIEDFNSLFEFDASLGDNVSFLPRSKGFQGRFKWYRLLRKNKIEFYRFGLNHYMDQPLYNEFFQFERKNIGAVVGKDTYLSWSPSFHRDEFVKNFKSSYLNISCDLNDFNEDFIRFIESKGLRYLSVTSPLKGAAGDLVQNESCNTLDLNKKKGLNTDQVSIRKWSSELKLKGFKKILIWGKGAMGTAFKEELGDLAELCSSRKNLEGLGELTFDALVWAAGTNAQLPGFSELQKKHLKVIYDLDYKEESNGRFLALETGALYISGKDFFETQAKAQQQFFKE